MIPAAWVNPSGHRWMTPGDEDAVLYALRKYCHEHQQCTGHEAVAALGLPDLARLPAGHAAWTVTERRRFAREARDVAGFAHYAAGSQRHVPPHDYAADQREKSGQ